MQKRTKVQIRSDASKQLWVRDAAGAVVAIGHVFGVQPLYQMLLGASVCIFLRIMAIYQGWRIPLAHWGSEQP